MQNGGSRQATNRNYRGSVGSGRTQLQKRWTRKCHGIAPNVRKEVTQEDVDRNCLGTRHRATTKRKAKISIQ